MEQDPLKISFDLMGLGTVDWYEAGLNVHQTGQALRCMYIQGNTYSLILYIDIKQSINRNKDETAEKYKRKQAVKRERREHRVAKKQTRLLFKREELKMD